MSSCASGLPLFGDSTLCYPWGVKRSLRRWTILCAILPQLLLALFTPALVVCQEADGARAVELGFTPCCAADSGEVSQASEVRQLADGCGGCEDEGLVVSLQREDEPLHWDFPPRLQPGVPSQAQVQRVSPARAPVGGPAPGAARLAALRTVVFRC